MIFTRTTYTSSSLRLGQKLRRKSKGLAYEKRRKSIPLAYHTPKNRPPGVRTPNSESLTEALFVGELTNNRLFALLPVLGILDFCGSQSTARLVGGPRTYVADASDRTERALPSLHLRTIRREWTRRNCREAVVMGKFQIESQMQNIRSLTTKIAITNPQ